METGKVTASGRVEPIDTDGRRAERNVENAARKLHMAASLLSAAANLYPDTADRDQTRIMERKAREAAELATSFLTG